jgi:hypothetical protein
MKKPTKIRRKREESKEFNATNSAQVKKITIEKSYKKKNKNKKVTLKPLTLGPRLSVSLTRTGTLFKTIVSY